MFSYVTIKLKQHFCSRKTWMFCLVVLMAGVACFFVRKNLPEKESPFLLSVGVVDLDNTSMSRMLVSYFEENPSFSSFATIQTGSLEEITDLFEKGELYGYFVIPEGFIHDLTYLKNSPIKVRLSTANPTLTLLAENFLSGYENYIGAVEKNAQAIYDIIEREGYEQGKVNQANEELSLKLLFTVMNRESLFEYEEDRSVDFIPVTEYYVFAFLSFIAVYGSLLLCIDVIKDKKKGILLRNQAVGFGNFPYVFGNLAVVLVKLLPVLLAGVPLFSALLPGRSFLVICLKFLAVFLVLYFAFQMLFLLCSRKMSTANMKLLVSSLFVFMFLLAFAGGVLIPYVYLPEVCKKLSDVSLFYQLISFFAL